MKESVEWVANHEGIEEHLENKYKWGENTKLIDWESHRKAYKPLPQPQKVVVCKGNYNWIPTNKIMQRIEPEKFQSPMYLLCEQEEETDNNLYQCGHHISRANQLKALITIREWGKKGIFT